MQPEENIGTVDWNNQCLFYELLGKWNNFAVNGEVSLCGWIPLLYIYTDSKGGNWIVAPLRVTIS